ncbi:hypothetical protein Mlaev_01626 [Microbacterium laevaniformans]|uniref:Uncharacterized protein n=1 Tax=Microbacterium laevaniformans TaxID=36807 RepID=A0A150HEU8_9MICO|nr:hypothetical protein [Microbacterium laevaniformans]KXZ60545.1 hypothetical protein Mlaev_01626 [Microbacterium laevaniformans]
MAIIRARAAVISLIGAISDIRHVSWVAVVVFVSSTAALVAWELRAFAPVIDVRMLARNGPLVRTYLRQALALMAAYAVLYGYVQWLETLGFAPADREELAALFAETHQVRMFQETGRLGIEVAWSMPLA